MKSIRTILLFIVFGLYYINVQSQTIVFSEDFEGATLNVTSTGTTNWSVTTSFAANGLKSDSVNIVSPNDTAALTTSVFSTTGYSNAILKFNHICKLEYLDGGFIEVSADNGASWTLLTDSNYFGTGQFGTIGNKFNSMSYGDWVPGNNNAIPDNSWWKSETFDISPIAGYSGQVIVRFIAKDGFSNGSMGAYGWLIDDIEVVAGSSELIPPTVTLQMPYIMDTVYSTGPFDILAKIEDNSGISNAIIEYTINSITDTVSMINIAGNNWKGTIPSQPYNTNVCYRIIATDSSLTANTTYYPTTGCISFITKKPPFIIEIGHATVTSGMAPVYITSATSPYKYSNHISLFTNSELQKPGTIKKISWVKTNLHSYNTADAKLRIYLKHTSSSNVPITAGSFATEITNATLVYEDTAQSISAITGWQNFTFNVDTFNYNGNNNLMVLVDWYRPDSATGAITWNYTTSPGKAITYYDITPNPGNTSALDNRPNILIHMDPIIYQFDAGISEVVNPQSVASSASAVPFEVRIKNFGSDTLKKANIYWEIDGVPKTPYNWTGSLLNEVVSVPVNIGSENLSNGPHNLKVWTSLPNDSIDQYFRNDTMNFPFFMCSQILSGAYTVGGGSADFNTINDVITALNSCGVNGPVTFNINPGIYYSQILLTDSIPGLSSTNTITFTSTTNNPGDVTIKYSTNSSTNNYIIALDGADNITIKNLTIKAEGTVFSNVIYLTNSANFNVIENCRIYSIPGNSTAYGILMDGDCGNNLIQNNKVYFGQYGISASGTSSKHQLKNIISGNIVKDFERFGIYTSNNDSLKIISNIVETSATLTSSVYGIYTYGCDYSPEIIKNKVDLYLPGAGYGLYYYSINVSSYPYYVNCLWE